MRTEWDNLQDSAPWTTHECTTCGAVYHTQMNSTIRFKCTYDYRHGRMVITQKGK